MIQKIVAFALRYRGVVVVFGRRVGHRRMLAFHELAIEAYPNPVPPMVEVIAQPPGWSAEETERYVTIPIEIGSGMPGLDHIRSPVFFGLPISSVTSSGVLSTRMPGKRSSIACSSWFAEWSASADFALERHGEIFRYRLVDRSYETKEEGNRRLPEHESASASSGGELLKLKTLEDGVERQWKQCRPSSM